MTILEQLRRDEDLRLKPYRDPAGKLTIGIGRNLDAVGISTSEAYAMLDNDVQRVKGWLTRLGWTDGLDPVRYAVLVNMVFNLGPDTFLGFTRMIDALKRREYAWAAQEMLDSQWAAQVGARAVRLAEQMREGKELL
jgi:lysozyme